MNRYLDTRHLKYSRWYDRLPSGTLRLKRVSAAREEQFPRPYRVILARNGPTALVAALLKEAPTMRISEAWNKVKLMVNGTLDPISGSGYDPL